MARKASMVVLAASWCCLHSSAYAAGNVERGGTLYIARCGACHSIDDHGAGPRHRGLLGRRAGSEPGFDYSPALRASKLMWSPQLLDRWLRNPNTLVPGNKMAVQLANDPADRADLIAYLVSATAVHGNATRADHVRPEPQEH